MIIPLTDEIGFVAAPNKGKYPYCNCLYINDQIRAVIDNCCGKKDLKYLLNQNIDVVINSHFHEDHILNNPSFPKSKIWAHSLDAPAIGSLKVFYEYKGITEAEDRKTADEFFIDTLKLQATTVHREFEDGSLLDFGNVRLSVVFTPGHTPGHCCFYEEKNGILFSSDIDLCSFGPFYGNRCCDLDDFIASIQKCIEIKPALVITSHNGLINKDISGSFQRYLDIIFRKEEMVRKCLRKPSTLKELVEKSIFYGDGVVQHPFIKLVEKMAIERHLVRLLRMNEIYRNGEFYYLR